MSKVLIIGAGGVGAVVTHKCAQVPEVFGEIILASRTLEKCEMIKNQLPRPIEIARVDADHTEEVVALIRQYSPALVINRLHGDRHARAAAATRGMRKMASLLSSRRFCSGSSRRLSRYRLIAAIVLS